jgi:hypothetical protein
MRIKIDPQETTRLAGDPAIIELAETASGVRRKGFYRNGWKQANAETAAVKRALTAARMEAVAALNEVAIVKDAMELAIVARESGHAANTKRDELLVQLRYNYSAIELARISGLSRQRVHQVIGEDEHYKAVTKALDEQAGGVC